MSTPPGYMPPTHADLAKREGPVEVSPRLARLLLDQVEDLALDSGDPNGPAWDLYLLAEEVLGWARK